MGSQPNIPTDLIERYVLGQLSDAERSGVEGLAAGNSAIRAALNELEIAMEQMAFTNAVTPPDHIKNSIFEAISKKAALNDPPILHSASSAVDYAYWLDKPEMVLPVDAGTMHFIPLAETADAQSAIVWLADGSPEETHTHFIEKFLVLEGSCEVTFNDRVHSLRPGSTLSIPLHTPHTVKVTSSVHCKFILQRIAA